MQLSDLFINILWGTAVFLSIIGGLLLLNGATTAGILFVLPCTVLVVLGLHK